MRAIGCWTCKGCGGLFKPESGRRKCPPCSARGCAVCGKDITALRGDKKVCDACKLVAAMKRASEWYAENKDRRRAYDEKRRAEKRHLYREASKRHRERHPDAKAAETGLRRKRAQHATPAWADRKAIKGLYLLARQKTKETGVPWHVDHVIPLRGQFVSGLHVESNLQLLPAAQNMRKRNRFLEHDGVK